MSWPWFAECIKAPCKNMKALFPIVAAIILPGLATSQTVAVMGAVEFLAKDVPDLELKRVTFEEAVNRLTMAVSTPALKAEVQVIRYSTQQNSDDFPFRGDGELLISASISDVSAHEMLEMLCFACGFMIDLNQGKIRCFQLPLVESISRLKLVPGSQDSGNARLAQVILPSFKSNQMTLPEAMKLLRGSAMKVSGKRVLPLMFTEYRSQASPSNDAEYPASVSLDLQAVPFELCLNYVAELSGCRYRMAPEGYVCIDALHTLYHPRNWRVVSLDDFARIMKKKPSELDEASLSDWIKRELSVEVIHLTIHRPSGCVYLGHLAPEEQEALRSALMKKQ
jgi:hypothetical protein